jgi:translation initiation factor RLI1
MKRRLSAATTLLLITLAACGTADRGKCEQACRNYKTVAFRDVEAAKFPEEKRAQALEEMLHKGLEFCIAKCQHANNDTQIACWTKAKNISELKTCD